MRGLSTAGPEVALKLHGPGEHQALRRIKTTTIKLDFFEFKRAIRSASSCRTANRSASGQLEPPGREWRAREASAELTETGSLYTFVPILKFASIHQP
jgi:hypothetical protein